MPSFPESNMSSKGIQKGVPLKHILNLAAVERIAQNISEVESSFNNTAFIREATKGLDKLELMERARHIAVVLDKHFPVDYAEAVRIICASMTPARSEVGDLGKQTFFYLPYSCYLAEFGAEQERFEVSMNGLYELTMRYTSEYAIRPYFLKFQDRTLEQLRSWIDDPNPHVRRLCSEGSRPTLPWGARLPAFLEDPKHTFSILDALKDDEELYVRRSVANHLGDLAKMNREWVYSVCENWLEGASKERKWLIRHAVRYWAKKEEPHALDIRLKAK